MEVRINKNACYAKPMSKMNLGEMGIIVENNHAYISSNKRIGCLVLKTGAGIVHCFESQTYWSQKHDDIIVEILKSGTEVTLTI